MRKITPSFAIYVLLQVFHGLSLIVFGISLIIFLISIFFFGDIFGSIVNQLAEILGDIFWIPILIGLLKKKKWAWLLAVIGSVITTIPVLFYVVISTEKLLPIILLGFVILYLVILLISRRHFSE